MRELNPDWTEPEIEKELARIYEDELFDTKLAFGQGLEDEGAGDATEGMDGEEQGADMANAAEQIADVAEDMAKGPGHDEGVTYEDAEDYAEDGVMA